jgi:hypothetical protein
LGKAVPWRIKRLTRQIIFYRKLNEAVKPQRFVRLASSGKNAKDLAAHQMTG